MLHVVSTQEFTKLILKCDLVVMMFLSEDVPAYLLDMRLANGKRSVAILPVKLLVYLPLRLDPFG